jgi:glycosyltransferase involved in cell wall biosynthesis
MSHNNIPSCSIIIAEYNNGKHFSDLFSSLISQENADFEVVIVDDCSADNSTDLIMQVIANDARFKLIKHNKNRGVGAAFKTAMNYALGEIIIMLGADDALTPEAVQKVIDSHKHNANVSLINFSLYYCDEQLKITGRKNIWNVSEKEYFYWESKGMDTFKKASYLKTQGFDENLRSAVDQDICFKLEEVGDVLFIDEPLYLYRKNPMGISQNGNNFPSKLNFYIAVFHAFERRKISGLKNISKAKLLESKAEYIYCKAFVSDRQEEYLKAFMYLICGYFMRIIYKTDISENTKKEINYCIYHLLHWKLLNV